MLRVRSSRRVATLKPTDYDHEIVLVDHDGAAGRPRSDAGENMRRVSTESRLLPSVGEEPEEEQSQPSPRPEDPEEARIQERPAEELQYEQETPHPALRPSIEIQGMFNICCSRDHTIDTYSPDPGSLPRCAASYTKEARGQA